MKERLSAFAGPDFSDTGHVQTSSFPVFLGGLPAKAAEVGVQGVEATVDPGVWSDLLQLTSSLHEGQAV